MRTVLLHCCHDDLLVGLELVCGKPQRVSVLLNSCPNHPRVSLEVCTRVPERPSIFQHRRKHNVAVRLVLGRGKL
jgi:hypothetical protein